MNTRLFSLNLSKIFTVLFFFIAFQGYSQEHPLSNPAQPIIDLVQHDTINGIIDFRIRWGHGPATGSNTLPLVSGLSIDDISIIGPTSNSYTIEEIDNSWEDGGVIASIAASHDVQRGMYQAKYRVFKGRIQYTNYSGPISIHLPFSSFSYNDYLTFPLGGTSYDLPLVTTIGDANADSNTLNLNLDLDLSLPWLFSINKAHVNDDLEINFSTNILIGTNLKVYFDDVEITEFTVNDSQGSVTIPKEALDNLEEFERYKFKIKGDSHLFYESDHVYFLPNHEKFAMFNNTIEHLRSSDAISQNTSLSLIWVGKNNMPTDHENLRGWFQAISLEGHGQYLDKIKGKYRGNRNRIVPEVINGLTFNREQASKYVFARIAEFKMKTPEELDSLFPSSKYNYSYNPIRTWRSILRGNTPMTFYLNNTYSVSTGFQKTIGSGYNPDGTTTIRVNSTDFNKLVIERFSENEFKLYPVDKSGQRLTGHLELDIDKIDLTGYVFQSIEYEEENNYPFAILSVTPLQQGLDKYEIRFPTKTIKLWDQQDQTNNLNKLSSYIITPPVIESISNSGGDAYVRQGDSERLNISFKQPVISSPSYKIYKNQIEVLSGVLADTGDGGLSWYLDWAINDNEGSYSIQIIADDGINDKIFDAVWEFQYKEENSNIHLESKKSIFSNSSSGRLASGLIFIDPFGLAVMKFGTNERHDNPLPILGLYNNSNFSDYLNATGTNAKNTYFLPKGEYYKTDSSVQFLGEKDGDGIYSIHRMGSGHTFFLTEKGDVYLYDEDLQEIKRFKDFQGEVLGFFQGPRQAIEGIYYREGLQYNRRNLNSEFPLGYISTTSGLYSFNTDELSTDFVNYKPVIIGDYNGNDVFGDALDNHVISFSSSGRYDEINGSYFIRSAITQKGEAFIWGLEDLSPIKFILPEGEKAIHTAAIETKIYVVSSEGYVYVIDINDGSFSDKLILNESNRLLAGPGYENNRFEYLGGNPNNKIISVESSNAGSTTNQSDRYNIFGWNKYYQSVEYIVFHTEKGQIVLLDTNLNTTISIPFLKVGNPTAHANNFIEQSSEGFGYQYLELETSATSPSSKSFVDYLKNETFGENNNPKVIDFAIHDGILYFQDDQKISYELNLFGYKRGNNLGNRRYFRKIKATDDTDFMATLSTDGSDGSLLFFPNENNPEVVLKPVGFSSSDKLNFEKISIEGVFSQYPISFTKDDIVISARSNESFEYELINFRVEPSGPGLLTTKVTFDIIPGANQKDIIDIYLPGGVFTNKSRIANVESNRITVDYSNKAPTIEILETLDSTNNVITFKTSSPLFTEGQESLLADSFFVANRVYGNTTNGYSMRGFITEPGNVAYSVFVGVTNKENYEIEYVGFNTYKLYVRGKNAKSLYYGMEKWQINHVTDTRFWDNHYDKRPIVDIYGNKLEEFSVLVQTVDNLGPRTFMDLKVFDSEPSTQFSNAKSFNYHNNLEELNIPLRVYFEKERLDSTLR